MEQLGVSEESLVTGAYVDLLLKVHKETPDCGRQD